MRLFEIRYLIAGTAEDSTEAFARIEETPPALFLMDISLPGEMDGIETASEICRRFNNSDCAYQFCS